MGTPEEMRAKTRSISKRHKANRKIGGVWVIIAIITILLAYLYWLSKGPSYNSIQVVAFLVILAESIAATQATKNITAEELAFEHVSAAVNALEEYDEGKDEDDLDRSAKELRMAGRQMSSFTSSGTYNDAYQSYKQLRSALRNKLPFYVTSNKESASKAKVEIEKLFPVLLNPSLERLKAINDEISKLPEAPTTPPRKYDWGQITERRLGQVLMSAVIGILLPTGLLYAYAIFTRQSALQVLDGSTIVFLGIILATFIGVLNWFGQLTRRSSI